jgi:hypothetical protein
VQKPHSHGIEQRIGQTREQGPDQFGPGLRAEPFLAFYTERTFDTVQNRLQYLVE